MAETPEAKVKKNIKRLLNTHGAYYAMPVTGGYGSSGVPDFLICHCGRFLAVEAKAGRGALTTLQAVNMQQIRDAGGSVMEIRENNLHELEEWLKNATNT